MFCVSVQTWHHSDAPIWAHFSWTQRMLEVQVWGQSGTPITEQGSHDMDSRLWGTEGLPKRPRCIGTERARTHLPFCSILSFSHNWALPYFRTTVFLFSIYRSFFVFLHCYERVHGLVDRVHFVAFPDVFRVPRFWLCVSEALTLRYIGSITEYRKLGPIELFTRGGGFIHDCHMCCQRTHGIDVTRVVDVSAARSQLFTHKFKGRHRVGSNYCPTGWNLANTLVQWLCIEHCGGRSRNGAAFSLSTSVSYCHSFNHCSILQ